MDISGPGINIKLKERKKKLKQLVIGSWVG
jgi:hypothetical protein